MIFPIFGNYVASCPVIEYPCDFSSAQAEALPTHQLGFDLRAISLAAQTCPANVETLTSLLLRDLPSYANRIIQRRRKRTDLVYSSVILAGRPEFTPIDNTSREYPPLFPQAGPTQVFITTLEVQYTGTKSAKIQQFHWLFLVNTRLGWRLSNIYSRTSTSPRTEDTVIAPPTESSRTIVGEAIRTWLNDCHVGKVTSFPRQAGELPPK